MHKYESLSLERENIKRLSETSEKCRALALNMKKVRDELDHKRDHFLAIKLIKNIRDQRFSIDVESFGQYVDEWLKSVTAKIIESAKLELADYFSVVRRSALRIGELLLSRSASFQLDSVMVQDVNGSPVGMQRSLVSSSLCYLIQKCGNIFRWGKWATPDELKKSIPSFYIPKDPTSDALDSPLDVMMRDLAALNRSLYTFATFDLLPEFHRFYKASRLPTLSKQVRDVGTNGTNCTIEEMDTLIKEKGLHCVLSDVIANVVGFFAVETTARLTSDHQEALFSTSQLTDLFEFACGEINIIIRRHFKNIRNPDYALQIKELLVLLCDTMADETFGLRSQVLYDTMQYVWELSCFLLEGTMRHNTVRALIKGQYQPFYVATESQFDMYIQPFKLSSLEIDSTKER